MVDPNPTPPAVSYVTVPLPGTYFFYNPNPMPAISTTNPSVPIVKQGECFPNCPLIAALDAITWVNRQFIRNNITGPDSNGNYTFTFWDYGVKNSMTTIGSMGGTVSMNGEITPCNPVAVNVSVGSQVLLDSNNHFIDPGFTSFGASSTNTNEVWPALLERAYAKFCYYENGMTPSTGALTCSTNTAGVNVINGNDPASADLTALAPPNSSNNYWGGNAAIALAYLIGNGKPCFQLSTVPPAPPAQFTPPAGSILQANVASATLFGFIKGAFCSTNAGLRKTRYPVVAWTYANGSQLNNVQFTNLPSQGILASHCYAVLGTFDATNGCTNGHSYIVLRTTFGLQDPVPQYGIAPNGCGAWGYRDLGFPIGSTGASGVNGIPSALNLSSPTDAIFGLDATTFSNYFQAIGWCEC
ncbi:hypothetical protein [Methanoregula sp.]|uniref:hypothetical protein n=1 Tax=Methanoregula sp. TaxID=2052170 RepID=UPI002BB05911|nr:hypothetical protein [Methanoregula sp.]HVP96947.1 hypothetical protein [Methanoregula sp.]